MIFVGPDPRDVLAILDADPNVRLDPRGSWLNAESGGEDR